MEKYQRFYVLSNKASESKCSCKQSINISKFLQNVKEHSFFVPSAPSLPSHMCENVPVVERALEIFPFVVQYVTAA